MDGRSRIPPGLPRPHPTVSYWQEIGLADIADFRTTSELPSEVDYLIVGSGISGCSIAYNLLCKHPHAKVALLEARQACSGATGRNGGHTKAASYRDFLAHEKQFGFAEAVKIARLQYANIRATHAFVREHGIACDSTPCHTVDILYTEKQADAGRNAIARMIDVMGNDDPAAEYHLWSAEEAYTRFFSPNAVAAISYPAGSISAYAFAIGVLRLALAKGLHLQTNTPVHSIRALTTSRSSSSDKKPSPSLPPLRWTAQTPRGAIAARNLVLATNGYTAHLLPRMQGLIVPLHGQVAALRPGAGLPYAGSLPTTYSYIRDAGYEYMITRPAGATHAGDVVIGGGIWTLPDGGASRFGETDDGVLEPGITAFLRESTTRYFGEFWGEDHVDGRVRREWSGIMGATADGLPYVGAVPHEEADQGGLWICAGFNGHGMVWCWKAAEALTEMMTGDEAARTAVREWFPHPAIISQARMKANFTGGDWQTSDDA